MKLRYIFFAIIELIILYPVFTQGAYLNMLGAIVLASVLYITNNVEKSSTTDAPLTNSEKIQVIITEILNPVLAGAFYYYCWKNKLPTKAKQANKYSLIVFGLVFLGVVILGMLHVI